jgi:hypothetical protein
MDILRDKIDEEFEKFDDKYSDKYEVINKKLGTTKKRLENLGKNFLTLYNKFLRFRSGSASYFFPFPSELALMLSYQL